jgi:phosphoglycolate phosphatase
MISNVLFDLDGTLTDPKEGITRCIAYSLDRLGRKAPPTDDLVWCIGPPLRESLSRLLRTSENALIDLALQHYRERFSEIGIYENSVCPGTVQALQRIHASGLRLFLATANPKVYATRILAYFSLARFFHGIYGSELDGTMSDKSDLVAHILKTERLAPQSTLIVGDRSHDILGGKKNGIMTAAVTYGYGSQDEIAEAKPDYVFHSLSDLAAFLETNGSPDQSVQQVGHKPTSC